MSYNRGDFQVLLFKLKKIWISFIDRLHIKTKQNTTEKNRNLILEMKVRTMNSIPFHEPIPEEIKKQYNL